MIEDQRQDERRRSKELQRQNYARQRAQLSVQELESENRDQQNSNRSCRQRTSDGVSHSEIQGTRQVDLQFSERHNQPLTTNMELDLQNEVSRTTDCVL